jgi:hypothetical protein
MEEVSMNVMLRPGNPEDAKICGAICYEAFKTIAEQHNFPPDFPLGMVVKGTCRPFYGEYARDYDLIIGRPVSHECTFVAELLVQ